MCSLMGVTKELKTVAHLIKSYISGELKKKSAN